MQDKSINTGGGGYVEGNLSADLVILRDQITQHIHIVDSPKDQATLSLVADPMPPSPYRQFIMRKEIYDELRTAMHQRHTAVVLHGHAGVGKTSIAYEATRRCGDGSDGFKKFSYRVWVDCQTLPSLPISDSILSAIALGLGHPGLTHLPSDEKREKIQHLLQNMDVLVILDDYDQSRDGAADFLNWLMGIQSHSMVLITSQNRVFSSVPYQISVAEMNHQEADAFINSSTSLLNQQIIFDQSQRDRLIEVTAGNPKAIEWILWSIDNKRQMLSQVLDDLKSSRGDLLKSLFERSWSLLSEDAKDVLRAATLFVGTTNSESLSSVAQYDSQQLESALEELTATSLLSTIKNRNPDFPARFSLDPLVRFFVNSRLEERTEYITKLRKRWLIWAASTAKRHGGWLWDNIAQLDELESDETNIYAAFVWAKNRMADYPDDQQTNRLILEIAEGLDHYYYVRGIWDRKSFVDEGRILAAHHLGDTEEEARSLAQHIQFLCTKGDLSSARPYIARLKGLEKNGNFSADVETQMKHAYAFELRAHARYRDAYEILRKCSDSETQPSPNLAVATQHWLATCLYGMGELSKAKDRFLEAYFKAGDINYQRSRVYCSLYLAKIDFRRQLLEPAKILLESSLDDARRMQERRYIALIQATLAQLYFVSGDVHAAKDAYDESLDLKNRLQLADDLDMIDEISRQLSHLGSDSSDVFFEENMQYAATSQADLGIPLDVDLDFDDFKKLLHRSRQRILMLDYDGTLAPFQKERDRAYPYPGVRDVLNELMEIERNRIVIVSGRSIEELPGLLGLKRLPEIWGSHGWERQLPDGTLFPPQFPDEVSRALEQATAWVKESGLEAFCEIKPAGLALHWRGQDEQQKAHIEKVGRQGWQPIVNANKLALKGFDGGIELSVPGQNKGSVVTNILSESGGDTATAYLGDDRTDEDAFRAIRGKGLGVLVRTEFRPTAASLWLKPPNELLKFLKLWQ